MSGRVLQPCYVVALVCTFALALHLVPWTAFIRWHHSVNLHVEKLSAATPKNGLPASYSSTYLVGRVKPMNHSHATCKRKLGRGSMTGGVHKICHFRSMCWDRVDRTFVYFRDPQSLPQIIDTVGLGPVDTWLDNDIQITKFVPGLPLHVMPIVERDGPIPAHESRFGDSEVYVYFRSFWAENFGHALGDDIMPAFVLQDIFGLLTPDSVLLIPSLGHPRCQPNELWTRARRNLFKLAGLVSDHPIEEIDVHPSYATYQRNENGTTRDYGVHCDHNNKLRECLCLNRIPVQQVDARYVCFRNLLAGHSLLGATSHDFGFGWSRFSDYILQRAIHRWPIVAAASQPLVKQRILVFDKTGRRRILNTQAIVDYLKAAFEVEVALIRPDNLATEVCIAETLQSSVILTPIGGISFGVAFARARSSVVFVTTWDPDKKIAYSFERHIWEQAHRFNDFYYDVKLNETTILPPGHAVNPTYDDYFYYASVTVDLARMGRVVASALTSAEHELEIPGPSFSKHMNHAFRP
jgi:hypothetical protein